MISTEEKTTFTIPEGVELIDDAFYVTETRFMWKSVLKDGKDFLFGLDRETVLEMSRWHLKCLQEGTLDDYTRVVNDGKVGGKL
jgi:hypothetical protein